MQIEIGKEIKLPAEIILAIAKSSPDMFQFMLDNGIEGGIVDDIQEQADGGCVVHVNVGWREPLKMELQRVVEEQMPSADAASAGAAQDDESQSGYAQAGSSRSAPASQPSPPVPPGLSSPYSSPALSPEMRNALMAQLAAVGAYGPVNPSTPQQQQQSQAAANDDDFDNTRAVRMAFNVMAHFTNYKQYLVLQSIAHEQRKAAVPKPFGTEGYPEGTDECRIPLRIDLSTAETTLYEHALDVLLRHMERLEEEEGKRANTKKQ